MPKQYDIIFISGEVVFDHPLSGIGLLKRLLETNGYSVGVITEPQKPEDIAKLGEPKLFFAVSSGTIDSMVRNYTPLKKRRAEDKNSDYPDTLKDRAVIVYCDWLKQKFKGKFIAIGGTESSLRRFAHYDYWDNKLRRPILFDSRADILLYGNAEKQILELAKKLKQQQPTDNIEGTCIITSTPPEDAIELPSFQEVKESKEAFCKLQNLFTNSKTQIQKVDNRYVVQYKFPKYTTKDLDYYYELPFSREVPKEMRGFQFSVVTHRGCIGACNFCALKLLQGDKIISRSKASILRELKEITKHPQFRGNIDDFGGPSANMYGMDCSQCEQDCIDCKKLDKSLKKVRDLLAAARKVKGINNIFIRSGIRYDLCTKEYLKEVLDHHTFQTLRIAPEHVSPSVLKAMNKNKGSLKKFLTTFKELKSNKQLSYYFMTAHPGSTMEHAKELANKIKDLQNAESVQVFTPTPMTASTCMYYTGLDPKTKKPIYIPYTYKEKKEQKRVVFGSSDKSNKRKYSKRR